MSLFANTKKRGKLLIKDGFLYIANDGRGFNRQGIMALCMPNLSSKSADDDERPYDYFPELPDSQWIQAYGKKTLNYLSENINELTAKVNGEKQNTRDYSGRWLFEILQNIDDALGPDDSTRYIGTKGLGFLSVFELGDLIQIYSEDFNFEFSSDRTTAALIERKVKLARAKQPPKLAVPWQTEADGTAKKLKKEGFSTVIRIDLFKEKEESIEQEINELEPYFLLLSRNIETLIFESESYQISFQRILKNKNSENLLEIQDIELIISHDNNKKIAQWRRWSREWNTSQGKVSSCAICLPLNNGNPIPLEADNSLPIYNFYPTDESSDVKALIHATFELSANRKHLQMHGEGKWESEDLDPRNSKLIENLSQLVKHLCLDKKISLEHKLTIFADIGLLQNTNKDSASERIKSSMAMVISSTKFIQTIFVDHLILISDIVFWDHDLVSCFKSNQKIEANEEGLHLGLLPKKSNNLAELTDHYGGRLNWDGEGFASLLNNKHIDFKSSKTRNSLFRTIQGYAEDLEFEHIKYLPILKTIKSKFISFNDINFVLGEKLPLPSFVKQDFILDKESWLNIENHILNIEPYVSNLRSEIKTTLILTHEDYLKYLAESENTVELVAQSNFDTYEFLAFLYFIFCENLDIKNELKEIGKDLLFHKAENSPRIPIRKYYFSRSWDKNPGLNNWLNENEKMNLKFPDKKKLTESLQAYEMWNVDKNTKINKANTYIAFFSHLGVSKEPKVEIYTRESEKSPAYNDFPYGMFHSYIGKCFNHNINFYYSYTDYGVDKLETYLNSSSLERCLKSVEKFIEINDEYVCKEGRAYYYGARGGGPFRSQDYEESSYLEYQLKNIKWITVNKSLICPSGKCSPGEIFYQTKYPNVFPSINLKVIKNKKKFLTALNIKTRKDMPISDWHSLINKIHIKYRDYAKLNPDDHIGANASIELVYKSYFNALYKDWKKRHISLAEYEERFVKLRAIPVINSDGQTSFYDIKSCYFDDLGLELQQHSKLSGLIEKEKCSIEGPIFNGFETILTPLSDLLNVKNSSLALIAHELYGDLEHTWELFHAIADHEEIDCKKYSDFVEEVCLCEGITLLLSELKGKDSQHISSQKVKISSPDIRKYNCPVINKIFIDVRDDTDELVEFLGKYITKGKISASLIEEIIYAESSEDIGRTLKKNGYPKNIVEKFKFVTKEVKIPSQDVQGGDIESTPQVKAPVEQAASGTSKKPGSRSGGRSKIKNIPSGRGHIRGTPESGHSTVNAFDDELPDNKKTGDEAEEFVRSLLVEEGHDNVTLLGGNNKGYDIEYIEGGVTKFVEVKGLRESWDQSDIMVSKSQFEKAQSEKENFILYIVENIDSEDTEKFPYHTVIVNPAKHFTKLQLDVGWRDFTELSVHLTPKAGRYYSYNNDPEVKYEITKIKKTGTSTRIYSSNSKEFIYQPANMLIHLESGEND